MLGVLLVGFFCLLWTCIDLDFFFFLNLVFKIALVSGVMLAVWEVATALVLLLYSLKLLSLGAAAFIQHRLKLPFLAFSALYNNFWLLSLQMIKDSHFQMIAFLWWCILGGTGCDGVSGVVTVSLEKPNFQVINRTELLLWHSGLLPLTQT